MVFERPPTSARPVGKRVPVVSTSMAFAVLLELSASEPGDAGSAQSDEGVAWRIDGGAGRGSGQREWAEGEE